MTALAARKSPRPIVSVVFFAVRLERGGPWDWSRDLRQQDGWDEHARFMDDPSRWPAGIAPLLADLEIHKRRRR